MSTTTGRDHIVVDAGAAATARIALGHVHTLRSTVAGIEAMIGTLSNPQSWDSAGAARCRLNAGTLAGNVRTSALALENTAATALYLSIRGVDDADAANGISPSAPGPADPEARLAHDAARSPSLPPVHNWDSPEEPAADQDGTFPPDRTTARTTWQTDGSSWRTAP